MESKSKRVGNTGRPNVQLLLNNKSRPASTSGSNSVEASKRPCREHTFLTDVADVRQMEQGLLQLLDDFHSGNLQAFAGHDCTFDKMDQVREQQERLARLHFELDSQHESRDDPGDEHDTANKNLDKLMDNLQELCTSIQNLQKGDHPEREKSSHESTKKKHESTHDSSNKKQHQSSHESANKKSH